MNPCRTGPQRFHECRSAPLLFVKIIYTLRKRGCQSDVLTGVRTRIYHSQKRFTSCAGTAPNVFYGCRNAPLPFVKPFTSCVGAIPSVLIHKPAAMIRDFLSTASRNSNEQPAAGEKIFTTFHFKVQQKNNDFGDFYTLKCC